MEINNSMKTMSGLEIMQSMFAGKIPYPSISDTLPLRGESVEKGNIVFIAQADERHLNMFGTVHGGFAATIMDSVTGCAVLTMLDRGIICATIELHVNLLHPIPLNKPLKAEGKVIHVSHSLGVAEGTLRENNNDHHIYAHATATCMILR